MRVGGQCENGMGQGIGRTGQGTAYDNGAGVDGTSRGREREAEREGRVVVVVVCDRGVCERRVCRKKHIANSLFHTVLFSSLPMSYM